MRFARSVQRNHRSGFSLIEVVVALAIIAALAVASIPSIQGMIERRRLQGFARDLGNVFQIARSQAIRTGNYQIAFFGPLGTADPAGTVLVGSSGDTVPMLIFAGDSSTDRAGSS